LWGGFGGNVVFLEQIYWKSSANALGGVNMGTDRCFLRSVPVLIPQKLNEASRSMMIIFTTSSQSKSLDSGHRHAGMTKKMILFLFHAFNSE